MVEKGNLKNTQTNKNQGIKRKNKIIEKDNQKNTKTGKKKTQKLGKILNKILR